MSGKKIIQMANVMNMYYPKITARLCDVTDGESKCDAFYSLISLSQSSDQYLMTLQWMLLYEESLGVITITL